MIRVFLLTLLALVLLGTAPVRPSPEGGSVHNFDKRFKIQPREAIPLRVTFVANERACVVVEGDHKPPMNLTLEVYDSKKNLVAKDTGLDFAAVVWYPTRTQ